MSYNKLSLPLTSIGKVDFVALETEYEEKLNLAKEQGQEIIKQATLRAEQKENEIIAAEKEAKNLQKQRFGNDGDFFETQLPNKYVYDIMSKCFDNC